MRREAHHSVGQVGASDVGGVSGVRSWTDPHHRTALPIAATVELSDFVHDSLHQVCLGLLEGGERSLPKHPNHYRRHHISGVVRAYQGRSEPDQPWGDGFVDIPVGGLNTFHVSSSMPLEPEALHDPDYSAETPGLPITLANGMSDNQD